MVISNFALRGEGLECGNGIAVGNGDHADDQTVDQHTSPDVAGIFLGFHMDESGDKRKGICFEFAFDDVSRKVSLGKVWSRLSNDWNYCVQDGDYTPQYVYVEKQVVSAIMTISGMSLYGNTVRYHIHQK